MFMLALAKINDKLSVIEKSLKPISDEESSDICDEFNALPLQTFEDSHSFEKKIKKDAVMYKKLVSRIRLLGKKNSKNSAADYVRRAWAIIGSKKSFLEMEYEFFVRETKQHPCNAKSRFDSAKMDLQSDEDSDYH
ncbi:hypothetical protein DAPPUDRAFT_248527 [Daphnia pulex]|uniref:DUF4806 domain-containing protein n=1 Tax=Daphnia pulex TaxID=6669 RepID=E9GUU8_DAPPU|nr:hypothetical protein DAPPUDRAFT_248527 [Daphnia pulex]|eukprot:EFX76883.1 hypothetical protein DAPPUDRAFT_248527 [Daphnia pulex]